jgi:hypothetical protein
MKNDNAGILIFYGYELLDFYLVPGVAYTISNDMTNNLRFSSPYFDVEGVVIIRDRRVYR